MKRKRINYILGKGTLVKNPDRVTPEDLEHFTNVLYIKFEDYWYIIKKPMTETEVINYLQGCRNKRQLLKKINEIV